MLGFGNGYLREKVKAGVLVDVWIGGRRGFVCVNMIIMLEMGLKKDVNGFIPCFRENVL